MALLPASSVPASPSTAARSRSLASRRGFFGETLRADPPDIWLPLQQEPLIDGTGELLHQSVSAWLRVIGRVRPGATITPVSARLTALLRHWIQTESGYPAAWMPDLVRMLPKQVINVVPAGSG